MMGWDDDYTPDPRYIAFSAEIRRIEEHIKLLEAARDGYKQWLVPIGYVNGHNGDDEESEVTVWAKDEASARYTATTNPHGMSWCGVRGEITMIRDVPQFNEKTFKLLSPKRKKGQHA
jgi:hypothetical protein